QLPRQAKRRARIALGAHRVVSPLLRDRRVRFYPRELSARPPDERATPLRTAVGALRPSRTGPSYFSETGDRRPHRTARRRNRRPRLRNLHRHGLLALRLAHRPRPHERRDLASEQMGRPPRTGRRDAPREAWGVDW